MQRNGRTSLSGNLKLTLVKGIGLDIEAVGTSALVDLVFDRMGVVVLKVQNEVTPPVLCTPALKFPSVLRMMYGKIRVKEPDVKVPELYSYPKYSRKENKRLLAGKLSKHANMGIEKKLKEKQLIGDAAKEGLKR